MELFLMVSPNIDAAQCIQPDKNVLEERLSQGDECYLCFIETVYVPTRGQDDDDEVPTFKLKGINGEIIMRIMMTITKMLMSSVNIREFMMIRRRYQKNE